MILSAGLCFLLTAMPLTSAHAQSNRPEGELIKSNALPWVPRIESSNVPIVSNLPMTMVISNLPLVRSNIMFVGSNLPSVRSNVLPLITNFPFGQQTNFGGPFYPPSPPPKKPWWRRFWDWLGL